MNDYISREDLIERLNINLRACNPGTFSESCYADAIETVKHFPAAVEAVPVSALLKLRDELYENDQITMKGLMKLNALIARGPGGRE